MMISQLTNNIHLFCFLIGFAKSNATIPQGNHSLHSSGAGAGCCGGGGAAGGYDPRPEAARSHRPGAGLCVAPTRALYC